MRSNLNPRSVPHSLLCPVLGTRETYIIISHNLLFRHCGVIVCNKTRKGVQRSLAGKDMRRGGSGLGDSKRSSQDKKETHGCLETTQEKPVEREQTVAKELITKRARPRGSTSECS